MMRGTVLRRASGAAAAFALGCGVVACSPGYDECGGEESCVESLSPPVTAAPGTGAVIGDPTLLSAGLLAAADLPGEFGVLPPREDGTGSAVPSESPTDPPDCARLLTPIAEQWPGSAAAASVHFAGPGFATIDIDAAGYADAALPSAFGALQALPRRCRAYSGDEAGVRIDYLTDTLEQPSAGDANAAFTLTATSEGLTITSQVALVQVGNTLVQLVVTAPESVDPGVLADLTAAQVRKLRG
ncbi:hypothetical protein [Nocardia rhizosphaerae]|uniref:PknH-like protein n=1 Tax=Nocardia rhizosphaerae TaxID=1691571 RepID=A0ABV8L0E8_9NOCA